MKNKRKKKTKEPSVVGQVTAPLRDDLHRKIKTFNWKLLLIVLVNTILFFGFYRLAMRFYYFEVVMGAYMVLTAGFIFAYFIYNRGMSRKGLTPEMLSDTMTEEEKLAYIEDGERRLKKSKWMLTIIFPLVLTFLFDAIELFLGDYFIALFK